MLPQWQPGIGYYVDFGGNAEIYIVPDPGVLHPVSLSLLLTIRVVCLIMIREVII